MSVSIDEMRSRLRSSNWPSDFCPRCGSKGEVTQPGSGLYLIGYTLMRCTNDCQAHWLVPDRVWDVCVVCGKPVPGVISGQETKCSTHEGAKRVVRI